MLGEPENQFSFTRAALSTRGAQKQIPISHSKLIGYVLWIIGFTGSYRFYYGK